VLAVASIIYTIYDWSYFDSLKNHLSAVALLGAGLVFTEFCFIAGGLIMALALGETLIASGRWWRRLHQVRRQVRRLASQAIQSPLFGFGFWLNFLGAVGTSVILMYGVVAFLPRGSWLVLGALLLDLIATFGWRVPLEVSRRRKLRDQAMVVQPASVEDIDDYLALQGERWSDDSQASRAQLQSRFKSFPQGMLVARSRGKIVGMVYAMRISDYDYDRPATWYEITHNGLCDNHDPLGKIIFGVDLSTARGVGGAAGDKLLAGIGRLSILQNVEKGMLGGRMPGYHRYAKRLSPEEYLWSRKSDGSFLDAQVNYYTSAAGLRIVKVLPGYFKDPQSGDNGVLLEWKNPFYNWPLRRLWAALFPALFEIECAYLAWRRRVKSRRLQQA
jgi:hypothetical protein